MILPAYPIYWRGRILLYLALLTAAGASTRAAEAKKPSNQIAKVTTSKPLAAVLPPDMWQEVERAVDNGLTWLASQQASDGSFATLPSGQPAVTPIIAARLWRN